MMKGRPLPNNPMKTKTFSYENPEKLSTEINKFIATVHRVVLIRMYRDRSGWYGWVGYKPNKEINDEK